MPRQPSQVQPRSRATQALEAATTISIVGEKNNPSKPVFSEAEMNEVN